MLDSVKRVIVAFKRSFSKKLTRRSAIDRFKARQYYKRHKTKLKIHRKMYRKKNKIFLNSRKLFKRTKPAWLAKKKKFKAPPKPRIKKIKAPKLRKLHVPKRSFSKKRW